MEDIFEDSETDDDAQQKIARVREVLLSLPDREADYVDMYFFKKMKQVDIAAIFNVSQPTVCYRLQRATSRLQFILAIPIVNQEKLTKILSGFFSDPVDVKVMLYMWMYTCQSYTARQLGLSQSAVRSRFLRSVQRMSGVPSLLEYSEVYDKIAQNLNILREIHRNTIDKMIYLVN
jgi:predicted transcriptional regulator